MEDGKARKKKKISPYGSKNVSQLVGVELECEKELKTRRRQEEEVEKKGRKQLEKNKKKAEWF